MIELLIAKTFWLTLTNISLGIATLAVLVVAGYSLIRDLHARPKRR